MERLNQNSIEKIKEIVERHESKMGPVKLMLHDVQHELGYIPFEAMEMIADACNTSAAEVYGVVTFYTQFTTEPKGKHVINVCMGTACYVRGAQKILDKISEMTKCDVNKTSADGMFSIDATRCLGACGLAPAVIFDGKVYGNVEQQQAVDLVNEIIALESSQA